MIREIQTIPVGYDCINSLTFVEINLSLQSNEFEINYL